MKVICRFCTRHGNDWRGSIMKSHAVPCGSHPK